MTQIVYFITPKAIIKVGNKALEFVPVFGPFLEYTKKAKRATELSDPVSASSRGIGMIFNYCFWKDRGDFCRMYSLARVFNIWGCNW